MKAEVPIMLKINEAKVSNYSLLTKPKQVVRRVSAMMEGTTGARVVREHAWSSRC